MTMDHGRVHWFLPEELDEQQRAYYDALIGGPRGKGPVDDLGRLQGAFNARLLDPPVGTAIQRLGAAVRAESGLSSRLFETAIIEVARHQQCEYELRGRRASQGATKSGLTPEEIEALRTGADAPTLSADEQLARRVVESLCTHRDLSDELFDEAKAGLGLKTVFDLVSIVGHFEHTALALRVWRVPVDS
jgi:4-carboxymuconolactone decarboxylase